MWKSWVALALLASLNFAVANICIADLAGLGVGSICYFSSGALVWCIVHFLRTSDCSKKEGGLLDEPIENQRVLLSDKEGKLDWKLVSCFVAGALLSIGMYISVTYTFKFSIQANLNIGIAESIWSMTPFLSALLDWAIFRKRLQKYHVVGICFMISCAALVSISQLFITTKQTVISESGEETVDDVMPIYIPILCSMMMPVFCSVFSMLTRYA